MRVMVFRGKKTLFVLLVLLLTIFLRAAARAESGYCGPNLTWTLDSDMKLTISGTGAMNSWNIVTKSPWGKNVKSVVIEEGVTSIGAQAFYNCSLITSVTLPKSLTRIDESAFYACYQLTDIVFPDQLNRIGDSAFVKCYGLRHLSFPGSLTSIGASAFSDCRGITEIEFHGPLGSIEQGTFRSCTGLTVVTLPEGLGRIGDYAFEGCSNLKSISLPGSLSCIEKCAFKDCTTLQDLIIPENVATVHKESFIFCSAVRYAVPASVSAVALSKAGWSFRISGGSCDLIHTLNDQSQVIGLKVISADQAASEITIPAGVTDIGPQAFANYTNTTKITIPDTVQTIDNEAFYNCSALTGIVLPEGLLSIGNIAFSHCDKLTSMIIPENVTYISGNAFSGCNAVRYATLESNGAYALSNAGFSFRIDENGCDLKYTYDNNIRNLCVVSADINMPKIAVPPAATMISNTAFIDCINMQSITLTDRFDSYPFDALFSKCESLEAVLVPDDHPAYCSVKGVVFSKDKKEIIYFPTGKAGSYTVPDSIETIQSDDFAGRTRLESITIPAGVTVIENAAFKNCTGLKTVNMKARISTFVFGNLFEGCTSLDSINFPKDHRSYCSVSGVVFKKDGITPVYCPQGKSGEFVFPEGVTRIGRVFAEKPCLESIVLPSSMYKIELGAFSRCTGLKSVTIPEGVAIIDEGAFWGCSSLESLTLPGSMRKIMNGAFYYCSGLKTLKIPEGVEQIGGSFDGAYIVHGVFEGCSSLTNVTVPGSVKELINCCFRNCTGLKSLIFLEGVEKLGNSLCEGCAKLTSVTLPKSLYFIGSYAFLDSPLKSVRIYDNVETIGERSFNQKTLLIVPKKSYAYKWGYENYYELQTFNQKRTVTVLNDSNGTASASLKSGVEGKKVTLKYKPNPGYRFKCWEVISGGITIKNNKFRIGKSEIEIKAVFEPIITGGVQLVLDSKKKTATVIGPESRQVTAISVPATFREGKVTYQVTKIAAKAFKDCKKLVKVSIGANVKTIGEKAFEGCVKLKTLIIETSNLTAKTVGARAFSNISAKVVITCPADKLKIYKSILIRKGVPKKATFK